MARLLQRVTRPCPRPGPAQDGSWGPHGTSSAGPRRMLPSTDLPSGQRRHAPTFAAAEGPPARGHRPTRRSGPSLPRPPTRRAPPSPPAGAWTQPAGQHRLAAARLQLRACYSQAPSGFAPTASPPSLPRPGEGGVVARLLLLTRELERPGQHGRHGGGPSARARARVLPGSVVGSGRRVGPGPGKVAAGGAWGGCSGAHVHAPALLSRQRCEPPLALTFLLGEVGR